MIHVDIVDNGGSGAELNITLRVYYDSSTDPGIERLQLRNQRNFPLLDESPNNCPRGYTKPLQHLSTSDAPFSLTVWGCPEPDGGKPAPYIADNLLPQSNLCGPGRTVPASQACLDAQKQATAYANSAGSACGRALLHKEGQKAATISALVFLGIAVALGLAALIVSFIPFVGAAVQTVLLIAMAVAIAASAAFATFGIIEEQKYKESMEEFNTARDRYRELMAIVRAACCPEQIHVPDISDCNA